MEEFPTHPAAADAPALFDDGHLWIQERVAGRPLRFRLENDARLRFGDGRRSFGGDVPRAYRHAVHHVERELDRGALRAAVEDAGAVTFFGVATQRDGVDYDWARLPSVLVTDVHDGDRFLPPARVEQVADGLGLQSVNAVAKEVRAADFDPESYEFPDSVWRDGPVAGVVLRNKTGRRAALTNDGVAGGDASDAVTDERADAAEVAAEYATEDRYRRVADELAAAGEPVTFDAVQERVLDGVYREHAPAFFEGRPPVEVDDFERAVARRTSEFLADR